jgi:sortase A
MRTAASFTQGFLFTCAVLMLGYCGIVLTDEWRFQNRASGQFEQLLRVRAANRTVAPVLPENPLPAAVQGLIGRIDIPRLGLSAIVVEGTSNATLRRAVGHIAGMALPGQPGNIGFAGHRDTFFRPLRDIRKDDVITVTTLREAYQYRVESARVVEPGDIAVLDRGEKEVLTLVTCYPFYFVGSAPNRFVVRAERI